MHFRNPDRDPPRKICFLFLIFQSNYMDDRQAALDLKDVPSPLHHPSSQSSQPFPLAPLPLPPPSLLHASQFRHDSQLKQTPPPPQQQQEGTSSKVSICTHCDYSDPLFRLDCKPGPPYSIAASQPLSSHPSLPCCSGLFHNCSFVPPPCSQSNFFPFSTPLTSVISSPSTLHGSCLASADFYTYGVDYNLSARGSQRSVHSDHPTTATTINTSSAHLCSNPLHLNVERTVCMKGTHFCQDCLLKVGRVHFFHGDFHCVS